MKRRKSLSKSVAVSTLYLVLVLRSMSRFGTNTNICTRLPQVYKTWLFRLKVNFGLSGAVNLKINFCYESTFKL